MHKATLTWIFESFWQPLPTLKYLITECFENASGPATLSGLSTSTSAWLQACLTKYSSIKQQSTHRASSFLLHQLHLEKLSDSMEPAV